MELILESVKVIQVAWNDCLLDVLYLSGLVFAIMVTPHIQMAQLSSDGSGA